MPARWPSGTLRSGDTVLNPAARTEATVARLVTMDGDLDAAGPGQPVTWCWTARSTSRAATCWPPPRRRSSGDRIDAWVVWMDDTPLFRGRAYQVMLGTSSVSGTVTDVTNRLDIETLHEIGVRELHMNEIGRVSLSLSHPIVCEPYEASRELGGFILVDRLTRNTVGAGMVTEVRAGAQRRLLAPSVRRQARARRAERPEAGGAVVHRPVGRRQVDHRQPGGEAAAREGRHTMILDGDNVRHGLNRDLGFSEADRVENIRRVAEVAKLFVEAGLVVLVSFISPYRAERMLARECVEAGEFLEIFVDTPVEECRRRDPKGLYQKADAGQIRNFTGVSAPYEEPLEPEIRLRTIEAAPEALAEQVVVELRRRGIVG